MTGLFLEQVVQWGYSRIPMVFNPGEVAWRGDFLDISWIHRTPPCPVEKSFFRGWRSTGDRA
ncbi:hypothetical protein [uncultured Bilophila sp.]|uniref:hypothetical protein n=1 Tax=uncultured Bilophila sp. TaxID=529385 RepID=UPI00342B4EA9